MQPKSIPHDWFVCPVTKKPLTMQEGMLLSPFGNFKHYESYWDFMPTGLPDLQKPEWTTWDKLQENGIVSYQVDPTNNLGVGKRQDYRQFADFCQFKGNILDIGVGPQKSPSHMEVANKSDVFFVGIDPLLGEQPRDFAFVKGLGEYLPFRNDIFDQVLFVTSLDHFIDPRLPLREAKHVVSSSGEICVWIGEKDANTPKATTTHAWYEQLEIPQGAQDKFHFKRFTSEEFEKFVAEADLHIICKQIHHINEWRRNLFYKLKK